MELLQHGIDQSVIALWLGHGSIETTQVYLHADLGPYLTRPQPRAIWNAIAPTTSCLPSAKHSDYFEQSRSSGAVRNENLKPRGNIRMSTFWPDPWAGMTRRVVPLPSSSVERPHIARPGFASRKGVPVSARRRRRAEGAQRSPYCWCQAWIWR
jgi:hypothetical protein